MAKIGDVEAIVLSQPHTLLSVKDMVQKGCILVFHPGSLKIVKQSGTSIPVKEMKPDVWTVSLDDVEALGARSSIRSDTNKDTPELQPIREGN